MFLILMTIFSIGCSSGDSKPKESAPSSTVIYLIRHAEKADAGPNPNLSQAGLVRANQWTTILNDVSFEAFYSTNFNRTLQTIQPTATQNGKEVTVYDYSNFALADVVEAHEGKNVMIVGHSNTIPPLINAYLGADVYPEMPETEFGYLYIIRVSEGQVTHEMRVHN